VSNEVDLAWILQVVEKAGVGDPAPDDLGVAVAAVERHKAELMGRPIYNGVFVRAAALAHTLSLRWLERSNTTVAISCALRFMIEAGAPVAPDKDGIAEFVAELGRPDCTVSSIADVLRRWRR
jgi:hypothetical protein